MYLVVELASVACTLTFACGVFGSDGFQGDHLETSRLLQGAMVDLHSKYVMTRDAISWRPRQMCTQLRPTCTIVLYNVLVQLYCIWHTCQGPPVLTFTICALPSKGKYAVRTNHKPAVRISIWCASMMHIHCSANCLAPASFMSITIRSYIYRLASN